MTTGEQGHLGRDRGSSPVLLSIYLFKHSSIPVYFISGALSDQHCIPPPIAYRPSIPPSTMLPFALTPPSQAKPSSITSSSMQQGCAYEERPSPPANSQEGDVTPKAERKRKKTGLPYQGHITLTKELLHFLHKAPDKGAHTIAKIAQRQILRAAACASKVRSILYDIFMEPLDDIYISRQLEKGKQHLTGTMQHKHSMGGVTQVRVCNPPVECSSNRAGGAPTTNKWPIQQAQHSYPQAATSNYSRI